jgi:hypothetical protein
VRRPLRRRGGALLAVLWLTAALSAIVFTVALTARSEVERAGTALDSAQAYFLAEGSIERLLLHLRWPQQGEDTSPVIYRRGQRRIRWDYPSGTVDLEVSDETGKLSVHLSPEVLVRLCVLRGVPPETAGVIAAGIVAQREAARNAGSGSSFSGPGASFQQPEDLLSVNGMTPDILYGWWVRGPEGRLIERGGLVRHLTMRPSQMINVNHASPEVLLAAGVPDGLVAELLARREARPLENLSELPAGVAGPLPSGTQLMAGSSGGFTVRATAELKRRPVRRTVTAQVRLARDPSEPPVGVVRWYQGGD